MELNSIHRVYFIGIGGIGMSALARYFNSIDKKVSGYDKTPGSTTEQLLNEGIFIHFNDKIEEIPSEFKNPESTLIIYTPAIPSDHFGYNYFRTNGFNILKRSEILGEITKHYKTIAVAGTHGKTSVSTATAHILYQSSLGCLAFLGGISKNYRSNLLLPKAPTNINQISVVEADEYDRSFLQLNPSIVLITAMDADHLDIYQNKENIVASFNQFVKKIEPKGIVIYKKGLTLAIENLPENQYTYSLLDEADFYAKNLRINSQGIYGFDLVTPSCIIRDMESGVAGKVNAENALAAASIAYLAGLDGDTIRKHLKTFRGVQRRFDFQLNNEKIVFIDDYAHHPEELKAFINSVREIFKEKKITGIFQPHLFSRTKDFAEEFAKSLDLLDELILLDIYPAREKPVEGVSSEIIFDKVKLGAKSLCSLENLLEFLSGKQPEVLLTMGAGNIESMVEPIRKMFEKI